MQTTDLQIPVELSDTRSLMSWGSFEIKHQADVEIASTALKEVEGRLKAIKAKQVELFGPLKKAIRDLELKVKDITNPLEIISGALRDRIGKFWDARQKQLEAEARAKREADLAEERRKAAEAMTLAMSFGSEAAMKEVEQRDRNVAKLETKEVVVSQTVRTSEITIAQMRVWCWKIVDEKLIPREYLIVDEKKLNAVAKKSSEMAVEIPGIEFYQESRVVLKK